MELFFKSENALNKIEKIRIANRMKDTICFQPFPENALSSVYTIRCLKFITVILKSYTQGLLSASMYL